MILKNAKIFVDGLIRKGALYINNGIIQSMKFGSSEEILSHLKELNENGRIINCNNKLILPGIIDIHSHLRDMGQSEKETFLTGTKAAAFSGITTVFTMPNTIPPAITSEQVKKWMNKAEGNIFVNVGFIAGVPKEMNFEEITKIVELGVIGFKIYPLSTLNEINWTDPLKIQKLLHISSEFQVPIFIHPDKSISNDERNAILQDYSLDLNNSLEWHDNLYPCRMEAEYVNFILVNYYKIIVDNNLNPNKYPIVHFCHISCKESYSLIKKALKFYNNLKITFEITPHHLILSKKISLKNNNFGKVLPPLRDEKHSQYLYNELKEGRVEFIGTDHAPHSMEEKLRDYLDAPSGFPGFETYPLLLLDKVSRYELSLTNFVKVASENPAKQFNLKNKGLIKEGFDADLIIVEKISDYLVKSEDFKTKAKFSPFEGFKTSIRIWKVFLRGDEINNEASEPKGRLIKRTL